MKDCSPSLAAGTHSQASSALAIDTLAEVVLLCHLSSCYPLLVVSSQISLTATQPLPHHSQEDTASSSALEDLNQAPVPWVTTGHLSIFNFK